MKQDSKRERRISMEIIVDAYTPEEEAMGWFNYLESKLRFPFRAECTKRRAISPLRKGDELEVLGMAPEDECFHEMFGGIRWQKRSIAVPLAQLKPVAAADHGSKEAVGDWHYWLCQGYEL